MKKLKRIVEEINKTEQKIAQWQEYLKQLRQQRKQLEDQEIIKTIRSMQLGGTEMLDMLDGIQNGSVVFVSDEEGDVHMERHEDMILKSEEIQNEE
jgi:predicted RNase H-like nuclease (RuvC/YqgF family)